MSRAQSFMVEGELFWRREHLADIREKLAPLARCPSLCEMRNFSPGLKRAFIANNGQPLTAGTIRHYPYPRLRSHDPWHYCVIRHALDRDGYRVVGERKPGVPILWAQPQ